MRKLWSRSGWRDMFFILIIVKLIYWLCRCCRKPQKKTDRFDAKFIRNQLIIMKKDDVSEQEFNAWKARNLKARNIKFSKVCGNCDDSLELWVGDNVPSFIAGGGKVASGGSSPGSTAVEGGGEDDVAYYGYNIVIDLPESLLDECELEKYRLGDIRTGEYDSKEPPVVVAVFDTGLLPEIKNIYTQPVLDTCISNGEKGWNFVINTDKTDDDNDLRHGSVVTQFIIDQAHKYKKHRINILPVKVHNSKGVSDLFSILCGFAYAANCGAKIINASFGFYARQKSDAPTLLKAFVKKHIEGNNILLIAAAGNANPVEDSDFLAHSTNNPRDLEKHPFYPASLSKECGHVLPVTTVSVTKRKATVSTDQNFSDELVALGVNCDEVNQYGHYIFWHPLKQHTQIYGSSYATPIVTGIIAQHYHELIDAMPGGIFDQKLVTGELRLLSLSHSDKRLKPFVIDGCYCTK